MSKYNFVQQAARPRPWAIHPIWRGIGCLLIVLLPVLAYTGAFLLVRENLKAQWVAIPRELLNTTVLPILGRIYYADLLLTLVLILLGSGLLTVFYAMVYRIFGPPRYGPLDMPPQRPSRKKS